MDRIKFLLSSKLIRERAKNIKQYLNVNLNHLVYNKEVTNTHCCAQSLSILFYITKSFSIVLFCLMYTLFVTIMNEDACVLVLTFCLIN